MSDRRHREDYKLAVADWPTPDSVAWHRACTPQPGPFSGHTPRSSFTYRKYAAGWGIYLWYLKTQDQLDPAETPAERVNLARLGGYFAMLKARKNSDYTILGRFDELRGALRLMDPEADVSVITRPQNIALRQMLTMRRKKRFMPDARQVLLWAVTLFQEALERPDPQQRGLLVRDAALIGILASRAPRLLTVSKMRLGRHLIQRGNAWDLFFDKPVMKGGYQELELPNDPRVNSMLTRYVAVERQALLAAQTHDAVWVSAQGGPLSYKGIERMFRHRTEQQFGVSFGPHRLRSSLVTTAAVVDGTNMLAPSIVLGHSAQTALKSYNRAKNLEATRRHDALINKAEDAAACMRRVDKEVVGQQQPVDAMPDPQPRNKRPRKSLLQLSLF